MDRHGFAHGLLRLASANEVDRQPRRWRRRPRLLAGSALLLSALLVALFAASRTAPEKTDHAEHEHRRPVHAPRTCNQSLAEPAASNRVHA
jgi:hypothetical protein